MEKIMANERLTESIVRDAFKADALFKSIKWEEQKSNNKRIAELLKNSSKNIDKTTISKTNRGGFPEFIISFPANSNYLIVIECKSSPSKHESIDRSNPKDYAVDGVLHYARYLISDFNVLAIAVSGETESELLVSHFLFEKGNPSFKELKNDKRLLSISDYLKLFANEQFSNTLLHSNIVTKAIELNNEYNKYSIPELTRNTIVSAILLALLDEPFKKSYDSYSDIESLSEGLLVAVKNTLKNGEVKSETAMIGEFSKIQNEPLFREKTIKGKKEKKQKGTLEVVKTMISYLHNNVYPLMQMEESGFDVLGKFYTEFIRYAGSEQKQGLVLTPPHIAELFCDLVDLNLNDVVYDPCCGTAGFLVAAMKRLFMLAGNDNKKKLEIRTSQLVGVEIRPQMYTYACSNMMLRGDGRSNIFCGSCYDTKNEVSLLRPTVAFLNPPYDVGCAAQMEFIEHALEVVAPQNGRVCAIVQMSCGIKDDKKLHEVKNRILTKHHLKAVLSMPDDLFYPVGVVTCVMIFEANKPNKGNKTWFGYFKNDGFEKKKNLGRVDLKNQFREIKKAWLTSYRNNEEVAGLSVKHEVSNHKEGKKLIYDEWCAEAYLETRYETLTKEDFILKLRDYAAFKIQFSDFYTNFTFSNKPIENSRTLNLVTDNWKWFRYDEIFSIKKGFYNKKPEEVKNGELPFIGATDSNNGITMFTDIETVDLTSKTGDGKNTDLKNKLYNGNCITVSNNGSVGYAFYQAQHFTCTHDVNPLYLKNHELNVYIAIFLCTLIEKEKYRWAYGRKWRPKRMPSSLIKLPIRKDDNEEIIPDWDFMESFIKTLPYSSCL
jgi:type I restriction-modification system DNA methylase subunit